MSLRRPKKDPDATPESKQKTADRASDRNCGICGAAAVFDNWLEINLCPACGAHETSVGWQARPGSRH